MESHFDVLDRTHILRMLGIHGEARGRSSFSRE